MDNINIQYNNTNNKYEKYVYLIQYLDSFVRHLIKNNIPFGNTELLSFYCKIRNNHEELYDYVDDNVVSHLVKNYGGKGIYFSREFNNSESCAHIEFMTPLKIPACLKEILNKYIKGTNKLKILKKDKKKYDEIVLILLCFKKYNNIVKIPKVIQLCILSFSISFHDYIIIEYSYENLL